MNLRMNLPGLLLLTLTLFSAGSVTAQKTPAPAIAPINTQSAETGGVFTDREGGRHVWRVSREHTLLWDNIPYLPVGGMFTPHSLTDTADTAWAEDKKALDALKAKGLTDLLIYPTKSLFELDPAPLQRLMDYLDGTGFQYGLSFGPGLTTPLSGTLVKPASYRFTDTNENLSATWQTPDCDQGYYLLADVSTDNSIARSGIVKSLDGSITIPTEASAATGKTVALLYPHKALKVTGDSSLPDIWTGFDEYRDRTLGILLKLHFGKGLRFFHDPLTRQIGLGGETDYMIPDRGFLLDWEAFLVRKYPSLEDLRISWAITEGDFKTHRDMARLVPLWANTNGVPYLHDSGSLKNYRILDVRQSRWWIDFLQCRNESIQYHMNALADLLKREVAEVPVVYTWTQTHPIFWNMETDHGYDGLCFQACGTSMVARIAGPAYGAVEQSVRPIWCFASDLAGDTAIHVKNQPDNIRSYTTHAAINRDLDSLRQVGIKGLFVNSFQADPSQRDAFAWQNNPEDLDWLKEFSQRFHADPTAVKYSPSVLFFPQYSPGPARVGFVPGQRNTLWLNSFYDGETVDWWPAYSGYTMQRGNESDRETVLVSLMGKKETHLWCPNPKIITANYPDGTPVPMKVSGNALVVTLDETPVVFHTHGQSLVPQEAAETMVVQLAALFDMASARKVVSVESYRGTLERVKYSFRTKDFDTTYSVGRAALDELTFFAAPYIWLDGERPYVHSLGEIVSNAEANNGAYLRLSTNSPPGRLGYAARYVFDVPEDARYTIWMAGTPPGPGTSPIKWRINTDPVQDPAGLSAQGPLYMGDRFGWSVLGTVNLKRGPQQSLTIYVTDRAENPSMYVLSIDALLITPRAFVPNGSFRPIPIDITTIGRGSKRASDTPPVKKKKTSATNEITP